MKTNRNLWFALVTFWGGITFAAVPEECWRTVENDGFSGKFLARIDTKNLKTEQLVEALGEFQKYTKLVKEFPRPLSNNRYLLVTFAATCPNQDSDHPKLTSSDCKDTRNRQIGALIGIDGVLIECNQPDFKTHPSGSGSN